MSTSVMEVGLLPYVGLGQSRQIDTPQLSPPISQ